MIFRMFCKSATFIQETWVCIDYIAYLFKSVYAPQMKKYTYEKNNS